MFTLHCGLRRGGRLKKHKQQHTADGPSIAQVVLLKLKSCSSDTQEVLSGWEWSLDCMLMYGGDFNWIWCVSYIIHRSIRNVIHQFYRRPKNKISGLFWDEIRTLKLQFIYFHSSVSQMACEKTFSVMHHVIQRTISYAHGKKSRVFCQWHSVSKLLLDYKLVSVFLSALPLPISLSLCLRVSRSWSEAQSAPAGAEDGSK